MPQVQRRPNEEGPTCRPTAPHPPTTQHLSPGTQCASTLFPVWSTVQTLLPLIFSLGPPPELVSTLSCFGGPNRGFESRTAEFQLLPDRSVSLSTDMRWDDFPVDTSSSFQSSTRGHNLQASFQTLVVSISPLAITNANALRRCTRT